MPCISADKFTSPILKKIANGDESVFSEVSGNDFNFTEKVRYKQWGPLSLACNNGHLHIVNRLLDMPAVAANTTAYNNYALHLAAENGHLHIVNRLLEMPAVIANAIEMKIIVYNAIDCNNSALRLAAKNGHLHIVNRLLEIPAVATNTTATNDSSLRWAAQNGHLDVVNRLLKIPGVSANATAVNNLALTMASENGDLNIVNRLLEIPAVATNAAADNNYALRWAAEGGYFEIAHTLAKLQWPRGVIDMPDDFREYLPAIYQGAVIASDKKEFEGMVKCWIRGNPASNTSEIHYPCHDTSSRDLVRIDKYNAPHLIMQYAGRRDVVNEVKNEDRVNHGMNTLLYSYRLHQTFQTAYEDGQKESRERAGYGQGAMVAYNPGRPRSGM